MTAIAGDSFHSWSVALKQYVGMTSDGVPNPNAIAASTTFILADTTMIIGCVALNLGFLSTNIQANKKWTLHPPRPHLSSCHSSSRSCFCQPYLPRVN